ncbi:MAG: PspC domain-containing protein [Actinomycetota bacterium]|nr:PspC domain-containing protein [Actinomycetota bacterium]
MSTPGFIRPIRERFIGGVCAAIANHYGWRVQNVRLGMALLILFTGVGVILYIALWIAIPSEL